MEIKEGITEREGRMENAQGCIGKWCENYSRREERKGGRGHGTTKDWGIFVNHRNSLHLH